MMWSLNMRSPPTVWTATASLALQEKRQPLSRKSSVLQRSG
ncbi:hypothetical protein EVA_19940 [gut metagenome]|uniref:Uncharacterized protein n=1 Tax=gut metagenome TaxID=749906 RepID=J9FX61_9ZZZZ